MDTIILTILLAVLIGIAYFLGLSVGIFDVPFTNAWNIKRESEAKQAAVKSYYMEREALYNTYQSDYYILSNAVMEAINDVAGSNGVLKVDKLQSILPSGCLSRVNQINRVLFFSFLINIANPGGSIRDGKLVANKVDFQRIANKINAHLLTFLEGTGYSYQNITVYMDEKGIYHLRLEGLRYVVPNMNREGITI